ncbi:MAG TPA: zinc ribbon domain-containing protein, partial [Polyangiaceae bacterium]|nr:zinc ribbon domain-containing protein [Polyangiaceae bacterium]
MEWSANRDEIGLVCGGCDTFCRRDAKFCPACGKDLAIRPADQSGSVSVPPGLTVPPKFVSHSVPFEAKSGERPTPSRDANEPREHAQEKPMDQARYYVCESCMTPVPSGHKFCGRCGAPVPDTMLHQPVEFYSDMQDPSKARLILIRGEGMDGLSYHLKADQHIVGRAGQVEFPDDPFVSPKHANFFYRDDRLVVRDEGSLNGVYYRIRGTVEVAPGDTFLAGEQLFRLDPT